MERAAITRRAAVDTQVHKSGHGAIDLAAVWAEEAGRYGWTADRATASLRSAGRQVAVAPAVTVAQVLDELSARRSTWTRADVVRSVPAASQRSRRSLG